MTIPLYRSRPSGFEILPASQTEAERVVDGVYLSRGLSNSFLVVTDAGRVIVNTGMGFEAPVHKRNYDAVDDSPVRYIILTQSHVDHVGGVDLLRQEGTEILAQANNVACQADDQRLSHFRPARSGFAFAKVIVQALRFMQANQDSPVSPQARPEPTLTFDDHYSFELGGQPFECYAVPGGETIDSLVIWLPDKKVCFAGNLFSALFGHIPNLVTIRGDRYREVLRFVDSLERVLALEPEWLLVGHHEPIVGRDLIKSELLRLRDATLYVHDQTVQGMNEGKDVHTLMQQIQLPPELEVGEGYGKVSWNVRAIWENYAGWFHHRSTTELYSVPAAATHPDLVELCGGPRAVSERAAQRLAEGCPVEAIQLAEVVLSSDPLEPHSLRVCRDAHRKLAEESVNFWLSSWLQKQIEELETRLRESESSS